MDPAAVDAVIGLHVESASARTGERPATIEHGPGHPHRSAADGETWSATWDTIATGVTVSLVSLTSKTGADLGYLKPDTKWVAALQKSADDNRTVLHFVDPGKDLVDPNEGFYWCAGKYGYSYDCGA
ncbi:hypothetical protein [Nocardia sp. NPDC050175]|uniref:hypothetical protein n=1 Tax=Nocardia sp. NPDC050175 TaxID=3364317 RepID=UPI0037AAB2C8